MKIGIDARLTYYRPGGIAEYTRHLIQELAGLDAESDYRVIQHHRDTHTLLPGPNFRRINAFTPCHHRWERWTLSAELLPRRLDIVHSPDMIPPQWGARRHVITVHDLHFLHYPQFMTEESLRHYKGQIEWAVRHADHILVISQATANDLINLLNVPTETITVHLLGVNEQFTPLSDADIRSHTARFDLPDTYILFVGTFEPRKNIVGLLDAYHILRGELPDAPPLVLAGRRGWLFEDIFAKVDALNLGDHVAWIEDVPWDDLPAIYNGARVFALPSHYEGFGLTALEAMACGTPPVVANRSSLPEVVGEAGLLVDPDDPADLAAALQQVLQDNDLHDRLREAGLARAAMFTWRKTAEIALTIYRNLL
jgi:glycosyltransferase involved in cell wall biosynthesis